MQESHLSNEGAALAAPSPTSLKPGFRRRSKRLRAWFPYLLVAPAVIYLMMITLYPAIYAISQSFYAVKFGPWNPVGFANIRQALG